MHITLVVACSKDGFIAGGQYTLPAEWTSSEDAKHFKQLLDKFPLHVMGRGTYEAHKPEPQKHKLKVVLTHHEDVYESVQKKGALEFVNLSADEFIEQYEKYQSCLVLGGSHIYTDFLESGLINEAFLTIEPINLDSGIPFLLSRKTLEEYSMQLKSSIQLNSSGTTLNHYVLIK